jgi:predicted DNA binding CopG/RHH family protein
VPRGTTLRNVRINDELWEAVQAKAEAEGRNASEVVRELLSKWVTRPPRPRPRQTGG